VHEEDLNDIRAGLAGKTILLMPYCHADHAWCHTREWHVRRYSEALRQVLALYTDQPDFRYFIDSWSEFLKPCLESMPDLLPLVREYIHSGRLALVGGHWANVRFAHVGDETSIRNMVQGRRAVTKLFPDARLDTYANLDVAIGHSQVPQLLRLAGYSCCFAWRPLKGLDQQGVPRSFIWRGLAGDDILVSRHSYGGWTHGIEFRPANAPGQETVDFAHTVRFAWERYLETPARQPRLRTLSFCQGGDDALPLVDQSTGTTRDIRGLMEQWNATGLGDLRFGTPHDLFDALQSQREDLPTWEGMLDPAELCYHVARNGKRGVWWLREMGDRELTLTEQLLTRLPGGKTRAQEALLDALWRRLLTYCTHAVEFLFEPDFEDARHTLEEVIRRARHCRREALTQLTTHSDCDDPPGYVVYNPLPEAQRALVELTVDNIDTSRKRPILTNADGQPLQQQITYTGRLARDFDVLVETPLAPGGMTQLLLGWSGDGVPPAEPTELETLDHVAELGVMRLDITNGRIVRIEITDEATCIEARDGEDLLEPVIVPREVDYWMPLSYADSPVHFRPETLCLNESGPLRYRLTRRGHVGRHRVTQRIDLLAGSRAIDIETTIDIVPDSALFALSVPLPDDATLTVDIPFGVEPRELDGIEYGHMGGGNYENIERRIPGIFWGKSWVSAESVSVNIGLITRDGPRYFRRHGTPPRLYHFLVSIPEDRETGWQRKCNTAKVLGRHTFEHRFVLGKDHCSATGLVRQAQQWRTALPVVTGRIRNDCGHIELTPSTVRLSAMYREKGHLIVRVVNMSENDVDAALDWGTPIGKVTSCDFTGTPVPAPIAHAGRQTRMTLRPWQIMTLTAEEAGSSNHHSA
jgi:hypothetical protein